MLLTLRTSERDEALEVVRSLVKEWDVKEHELSDVSAEIERRRAAKRRIVIHQLRQLVEYWGITERELARSVKRRRAASPLNQKYRHPVSGETWSGEGPQPEWLKTALVKDGYRVEELRAGPEASERR